MFQNLDGVAAENNGNYSTKKIKKLNILSNVFELRNIAVYVVAFMVSMVGLGGDFSPFAVSIFAACFANSIPSSV